MFVEWHTERLVDDALALAMKQKPQMSDGIDNGYDHYYTVKVRAVDDPRIVKQTIKKKLDQLQQEPEFDFYPSDYGIQYAGEEDKNQLFYVLGYLKREIKGNEEDGWLPSKGVYAPNKVVQTRMSAEN